MPRLRPVAIQLGADLDLLRWGLGPDRQEVAIQTYSSLHRPTVQQSLSSRVSPAHLKKKKECKLISRKVGVVTEGCPPVSCDFRAPMRMGPP